MKKITYICFIVLIIIMLFLLKQFYFPSARSFERINNFKAVNEKNEIIPCGLYKEQNGLLYIIVFDNFEKTRLHINFEENLIGFPEHGYKNYKLTRDKKTLYLYDENVFYDNGVLFHPFSAIELVKIQLYHDKNTLELSTEYLYSIKEYGSKIILQH